MNKKKVALALLGSLVLVGCASPAVKQAKKNVMDKVATEKRANNERGNLKVKSAEEAEKIAVKEIKGLGDKYVAMTRFENEMDDRPEYHVEVSANGSHYDITVDALTGKVTEFEQDTVAPVTNGQPVNSEQAEAIAVSELGSDNYESIFTVEDRTDSGNVEYEVTIMKDGKMFEFTIDGATGQVLERLDEVVDENSLDEHLLDGSEIVPGSQTPE